MRDIEDDAPSSVNAEKAYQLGREIYDVQSMGKDVPWLQAFNAQLSHYGQRAALGEEYNFGAP